MKAVGIDLGTTNSEVAIVENGQARVLPGDNDDLILPSCIALSDTGKLLVGRDALRQYAAAPERTIKSIKRSMGTEQKFKLGDKEYLPEEISAIILRSLKQRAENALGETINQAVITVPAYFTDAQRQATKIAGEIAGFEVLQIINEPTAAALAYDVRSSETERVLVYDLGGGTFDVSIVEITGEVTEVLASHGNNHLGGDDFDRLLQLHLTELFYQEHGVHVPDDAITQARLLRAAEELKINLSCYGFATVREAFLATKDKTALHLEKEVSRSDFEKLIRPLLEETLDAIDRTLTDANLEAEDIDKIILVGGSTRIPLVEKMIEQHLGQTPTDVIQPDLCVALGAALQAGVLVGDDVEAILVDVIPHSLGIATAINTPMGILPGFFDIIIPRNSVIPVSRSQVYSTLMDNQEIVEIEIFQGENAAARENVPLGSYKVEGLPPKPAGNVQVEVHFDFDLNGILTVTTTEKGKGHQGKLAVNNTSVRRLSSNELNQARENLEALFSSDETVVISKEEDSALTSNIPSELTELIARAQTAFATLDDEQILELQELLDNIEEATKEDNEDDLIQLQEELEDFLYYVASEDD